MDARTVISISVQNLLEFSMQTGDLGAGSYSVSRAVEGTKGHNTVRKAFRASLPEGTSYESEVVVSYRLEGVTAILEVSGRIDGVIKDSTGITIHEIKTTTLPAGAIGHDYNPRHWAQAKCYAYFYSLRERLESVCIHLTYYNIDDMSEKSFLEYYSFNDLEDFFLPMAEDFIEWQEFMLGWKKTRDDSILGIGFPYSSLREGQQELINEVYGTVETGGSLFVQAPTGTGKTIASLYPAVKAMGNGLTSKIFYLTAKTTTRAIAEKALEDMRKCGLHIKSLTITAKEKTCPNGVFVCDAGCCEYAANYYGKVKKALLSAFREDCLDRRTVESVSEEYTVCPFELSLDLSLWCDVVICDYNYLFDPRVYLKRFFLQQKSDYCFLIDEAHNLVDRAREMFSAELARKMFQELKLAVKDELPVLHDIVARICRYFINIGKDLAEDDDGRKFFRVKRASPDVLPGLLAEFTQYVDGLLSRNYNLSSGEEILDVYFECLSFSRILELYGESHVTYYDKTPKDLRIKLFCVDPSALLKEAAGKGRSAVFFSATLTPLEYFTRMLGGGDDATVKALPSPFPRENLCVYLDDTVSTRYKTRQLSFDKIAETVLAVAEAMTGNYMVFFPSFEYLNEVYYRFMGIKTGIRTVCQTQGMSEQARQGFLDEFEFAGETGLVGFAVMGGVFGEGIDLVGEKLSGAVIVGVGLPQVCNERNIIKSYFDMQSGRGFEYAYVYPGLNRVLQAAGRVIRTENDKGVIVLLDERLASFEYMELLPWEWQPVIKASDGCELAEVLSDFWGGA